MKSLGKQIQEARKAKNMGLPDVARAMHMSEAELAALERDEYSPTRRQLEALGDQLGTVFFDPQALEAQRKADEATEREKQAEFRGKKSKGSGEGGASKMWVIPVVLVILLAAFMLVMVMPMLQEISDLKSSMAYTDQQLKEAEKKLSDMAPQIEQNRQDALDRSAMQQESLTVVSQELGALKEDAANASAEISALKADGGRLQQLLGGEGTPFTAQGRQTQFLSAGGGSLFVTPIGTAGEVSVTRCGENWAAVERARVQFSDEAELTFTLRGDKRFVINGEAAAAHAVALTPGGSVRADSPVLFTLYAGETYYISGCRLVYFNEAGKAQLISDGLAAAQARDAVAYTPAADIPVRGIQFYIPAGASYTEDVVWEPYVGKTRPLEWAPYRGNTYTWTAGQEALEISAWTGVNTLFSPSGASLTVQGQRGDVDSMQKLLKIISRAAVGEGALFSRDEKQIQADCVDESSLSIIPSEPVHGSAVITQCGENWAKVNRSAVKFANDSGLTFTFSEDKRFTIEGVSAAKHAVFLMPGEGISESSPVLFTLYAGRTYYISACRLVYYDAAGAEKRISDGLSAAYARDAVAYTPEEDIQIKGIQFFIPENTVYSADVTWEPYVGLTRPDAWVPYQGTEYIWTPGQGILEIQAMPGINTIFAPSGISLSVQGLQVIPAPEAAEAAAPAEGPDAAQTQGETEGPTGEGEAEIPPGYSIDPLNPEKTEGPAQDTDENEGPTGEGDKEVPPGYSIDPLKPKGGKSSAPRSVAGRSKHAEG